MLKNDVIWPDHRQFKSRTKWEPVGFFSECLCNATTFDIMLGFFSSSAIEVLSDGFAMFLHNGGKMRLVINDLLSQEDIDFINSGITGKVTEVFDLSDLKSLSETLSKRDKHFFDCLSYLLHNNRLEIKIIRPKFGQGISHTKMGVFSDGVNAISFNGSCNFSKTALVSNIESIDASCDWDGEASACKVKNTNKLFTLTFTGHDDEVEYVNAENLTAQIISAFPPKEIAELLGDEIEMLKPSSEIKVTVSNNVDYALKRTRERLRDAIKRHGADTISSQQDSNDEITPQFPYSSGPRAYQIEAFENWKNNKQRGLFAMATGTGKTLTALNCLLNIYQKTGSYKALILVPTIVLVDQWAEECKKFHFGNIIKVYSRNSLWKQEIGNIILKERLAPDDNTSYIVIATYASFARENVYKQLTQFSKKRLLLIADEAHNMGAGKLRVRHNTIPYLRRIGLSATPGRQFDDEGNKSLNTFFGIIPENGYTFEYSMAKAIEEGFLCRYTYYPHVVHLNSEEMEAYMELSVKIAKFYNFNNDSFKDDEILTALLLKRKRLIHKAAAKKEAFREILQNRLITKGSLKYTLVYVPEGNEASEYTDNDAIDNDTIHDDESTIHLIDEYTAIVADTDPHVTVKQFTASTPDRDDVLQKFASGEINVLTSMKCLDEGVDVPRSELAIFCASTGNPRQFIQRRGRILRTHPDKAMAEIHDLVVAPLVSYTSPSYAMERNMLNNEMRRVREFANLAENSSDTVKALEDILAYYNLSIFQ